MLSLFSYVYQYFILCKNVYIMIFTTDITTAVTSDIIAYLVVMTFYVETSQLLIIYL